MNAQAFKKRRESDSSDSAAAIAVSRPPSSRRVSETVLESSIGGTPSAPHYGTGDVQPARRHSARWNRSTTEHERRSVLHAVLQASVRATYCPVPTGLISGLIFLRHHETRVTRGDTFS